LLNNVKLGLAMHMEALLRALALRRKNLGMKTILELSYVFSKREYLDA
jgi:hypothetical protein